MKLFRKIHLWLSIPFGIIITLICFSGAMLVFEPEITRYMKSEIYYVASSQGEPLPMEELMETAKASLPDSVSITGVTVFDDKDRTYQINLSKPRRASIFIDQYSGKITGSYRRIGFFSTMFKLHRWLLDGANPHGDGIKVGKLLVGISTLMFVITLITGVVIWWPRARKNFKQSISISFKNGWHGFWKGTHVAGGMYALLFVLAMSLTGLTWSFDWYRSAFYAICGVEHTPRNFTQDNTPADKKENNRRGGHRKSGNGESQNERHRPSEFGHWQQVYDNLKAQNPDAPQITIGAETATVTINTTGNSRASDKYAFDRRSGKITQSTRYADTVPADRLRGWIYAIHTGNWGGLLTRIVWFLSALLGASLPLTGYYIWIKRLVKKSKAKAEIRAV